MAQEMEAVSVEKLQELKQLAGIPNLPTQDTYWYRKALSGEGPHAFEWTDKPHRLVFDLCRIIEATRAKAEPAPSQEPVALIETRNDTAGFIEFLNSDRPTIVRDLDSPAAILIDVDTREVIGYRVYDPDSASDIAGLVERARLIAVEMIEAALTSPNFR